MVVGPLPWKEEVERRKVKPQVPPPRGLVILNKSSLLFMLVSKHTMPPTTTSAPRTPSLLLPPTTYSEDSSSCLMGPSWITYIFCILGAIVFIIIVVWLCSYWNTSSTIQPNFYTGTGKMVLSQFSLDSVEPIQ